MILVAKKKTGTPFGLKLKEFRQRAELSQAALGDRVGMGRDKIARLETSPDANPTLDTITKLAVALGCSPGDLVPDVE